MTDQPTSSEDRIRQVLEWADAAGPGMADMIRERCPDAPGAAIPIILTAMAGIIAGGAAACAGCAQSIRVAWEAGQALGARQAEPHGHPRGLPISLDRAKPEGSA